jgi:hypothetical protein
LRWRAKDDAPIEFGEGILHVLLVLVGYRNTISMGEPIGIELTLRAALERGERN